MRCFDPGKKGRFSYSTKVLFWFLSPSYGWLGVGSLAASDKRKLISRGATLGGGASCLVYVAASRPVFAVRTLASRDVALRG